MKSKEGFCLAIIVSAFLFYLLTIRGGQPWPDDFAMYIREAKSLVDHTPLSQTGYIYNPYNASLGPRLYPPVFPVLLVPGYEIGGLDNLVPMKIEIVIFFGGFLLILWRGLGKYLSPPYCAALLAIVAFNPLLWSYKDLITSDIPFTFFLFFTLALADWSVNLPPREPSKTHHLWRIVSLAVLIYLCYGTRTMGIALVPALLLIGALSWKRGGRSVAAGAAFGLIPCVIQMKLFGGEASYLDQLRLGFMGFVRTVLHNIVNYGWSLATFWENSYSKAFRDVLFACITLLALGAYFRRLRSRPRIYEIFIPLYLGIVLLWPNPAGARYLIPIFPLYVYYCLEGAEAINIRLHVRRFEPVFVPLVALIFVSYCAQFTRLDFGPYSEGMANSQTKAFFSFIQSNTSTRDVFIFRRPRAFALFTGRSASIYPEPEDQSNFAHYFQTIGATYLVEAPALDDPAFDQFVDADCPAKKLVFSNSDFRVFHVNLHDPEACNAPAPANSLISKFSSSTAP